MEANKIAAKYLKEDVSSHNLNQAMKILDAAGILYILERGFDNFTFTLVVFNNMVDAMSAAKILGDGIVMTRSQTSQPAIKFYQ